MQLLTNIHTVCVCVNYTSPEIRFCRVHRVPCGAGRLYAGRVQKVRNPMAAVARVRGGRLLRGPQLRAQRLHPWYVHFLKCAHAFSLRCDCACVKFHRNMAWPCRNEMKRIGRAKIKKNVYCRIHVRNKLLSGKVWLMARDKKWRLAVQTWILLDLFVNFPWRRHVAFPPEISNLLWGRPWIANLHAYLTDSCTG